MRSVCGVLAFGLLALLAGEVALLALLSALGLAGLRLPGLATALLPPAIVVALVLWRLPGTAEERWRRLMRPGAGRWTAVALLDGLGVMMVLFAAVLLQAMLDGWAGHAGAGAGRLDGHAGWILSLMARAAMEEVLFRGYILGEIFRMGRPWLAVLASSALFAVLHLPADLSVAAFFFVAGLAYAWVTVASGRLWPAILLHALWNGGLTFLVRGLGA
jgi:hypothetical protein